MIASRALVNLAFSVHHARHLWLEGVVCVDDENDLYIVWWSIGDRFDTQICCKATDRDALRIMSCTIYNAHLNANPH